MFCSNGNLNAWHIAPDAFTIVGTLNDMSFQHLCDTLQLLKLDLVAGILGDTEKTINEFILDGGTQLCNPIGQWTEIKIFVLPVLT